MKIAILTNMFLPVTGGAEIFAYNISNELRGIGNTVHAYISAGNYSRLPARFHDGLRPLPKKFFGLANDFPLMGIPLASRHLRRVQAQENYDVWVAIGAYPSGYIASCFYGRVPVVMVGTGADIQVNTDLGYGARLNKKIAGRIEQSVNNCDKIIVPAETVRSDFLGLGVDTENIVTIPHGVDVDWFSRERSKADLRSEIGWPNDRQVILTTGRNHPKKGFNLIPAIANKLREDGLDFWWCVVGKGTEVLNEEIENRGLIDHLVTRDAVSLDDSAEGEWRLPNAALVKMYQAADIYAFPSLFESFGIVQLEAMAAGIPVLSTDAPGCREVVVHEENGLQAQAGNVDDFASQLTRLLNDPELRDALSQRGHKFVNNYSWSSIAKCYESLFQNLLDIRPSSLGTPRHKDETSLEHASV